MNLWKLKRLNITNGVIKSPKAKEALLHVVKRAQIFNKSNKFVRIAEIGLSGSSLRTAHPRDIDIIVQINWKKDIDLEWKVFQQRLMEAYPIIWGYIEKLRKKGRRVNIVKIYNEHYKELKKMGFQKEWIDNWLVWLNVSDYEWGAKRHCPLPPYFDHTILVSRYLRHGWFTPRMEFLVIESYDESYPYTRPPAEPETVPYIIFWKQNVGFIRPSNKSLQRFFIDETSQLQRLRGDLLKLETDEPLSAYEPAITLLKHKPAPDWEGLKPVIDRLMVILKEKIIDIKRLAKNYKVYDGIEFNTILTHKLKVVALVGMIIKRILANERRIEYKVQNGRNLNEVLFESIYGFMIKSGYHKRDIKGIIDLIDSKGKKISDTTFPKSNLKTQN